MRFTEKGNVGLWTGFRTGGGEGVIQNRCSVLKMNGHVSSAV